MNILKLNCVPDGPTAEKDPLVSHLFGWLVCVCVCVWVGVCGWVGVWVCGWCVSVSWSGGS